MTHDSQYKRHIRLLSAFLGDDDQDIESIDDATLARFLASPMARCRPDGTPKKKTSTNALRSSLRTFFGYLHDAGFIAENPTRLIQPARCSPPPPRCIPEADQDRLLGAMAEDRTDDLFVVWFFITRENQIHSFAASQKNQKALP